MNVRLILVQVVVLAAAAGLYFLSKPPSEKENERAKAEELLLADFHVDKVKRISVKTGKDAAEIVKRTIKEGEKETEKWFVESAYNCEADEKNVDNLLDEFRKLKKGIPSGSNADMYSKFGLDEASRSVVAFKDAEGRVIAEIHLGKQNFGAPDFSSFSMPEKDTSTTFVRVAADSEVRRIPGAHSVSAVRTQWTDLKITDMEPKSLTGVSIETPAGATVLSRHKKDADAAGKPGDKPGEKPGDKEKKKEEFEWRIEKSRPGREVQYLKTNESDVDSFLRSFSSLRGTDVVEPLDIVETTRNEGGRPVTEEEVPAQQKAKYGFDKPALVIRAAADDKEETLLVVGKVSGAGDKKEEGASAAGDKYYAYLPEMRSSFQIAISKALGMDPGQETKRFLRVFVLDEWRFGNLNKTERDFREKAKESKDSLVKGFFEDEVDRIVIESAEGKIEIARRISDFMFSRYGREIWGSATHYNYPVDTKKVEELLRKVKDLKMGEILEANEKNLKQAGLEAGTGTRVAFIDKAGKTVADFRVGTSEKVKDKEVTYFMPAGDQDIREVPGSHVFRSAASEWVDYTVTNCDLKDVDAVFIHVSKDDGGEVENIFVRSNTGGWVRQTISDGGTPKFIKIDETKVEAFANLIAHLSGGEPAPPMVVSSKSNSIPEAQLAPYGFDRSYIRAGFQRSDGSQLWFRIGKKDAKYYIFMFSGERQGGFGMLPEIRFRVFELSEATVKALDKPQEYYSAEKKEEPKDEGKDKGGQAPGGGTGGAGSGGGESKPPEDGESKPPEDGGSKPPEDGGSKPSDGGDSKPSDGGSKPGGG